MKLTINDYNQLIEENINKDNFEVSLGLNLQDNTIIKRNILSNGHYLFLGNILNGKSILLRSILSQVLSNKYTEVYLIHKGDLDFLENTQKISYVKSYKDTTSLELFGLLNNIILEIEYRDNLFKEYNVSSYADYIKLQQKDNSIPILTHLNIIIEEYTNHIKNMSKDIDKDLFNNEFKKILNRSLQYGITFFIISHDNKKEYLGNITDVIKNIFIGKSNYYNIPDQFRKEVIETLNENYIFYNLYDNSYMYVPLNENLLSDIKFLADDNVISDRFHFFNIGQKSYFLLQNIYSDIFKDVDTLYVLLNINKDEIHNHINNSTYIPLSILIYYLYREYKFGTLNSNNFIIKDLLFNLDIDNILYNFNINLYNNKNNKLLINNLITKILHNPINS